jgi:hypothetical protein
MHTQKKLFTPIPGLFLDQCTLKDRSRIKACVIGPPEIPSVFLFFLNWKVNQQLSSAFLVFDLIGRNAGLKRECTAVIARSARSTKKAAS